MNHTEILTKLKQTFSELMQQSPKKDMVKMLDAVLADGTAIQVTELAVGGIVTINGTPAPMGEHKLQDGTIIVVGDNGAIMEIKTAEVMPEEPPMMEDMGAKFSAFESATNEKFTAYETKLSAYEQKFAEFDERLSKANIVIEGLLNLTQTIATTPTGVADDSVKSNNNFKEEKKVNYDILFS
jgi:spore coat protein CotH